MKPDPVTLHPDYRSFLAKLRADTTIDQGAFEVWVSERIEDLGRRFFLSGLPKDECQPWLREQYIRSTRGVL